MSDKLASIEKQVAAIIEQGAPPLARWHPALSGDIDILIDREGHWFHEGRVIKRPGLVRLFASILRREDDGDYYLVTPVEKWRLRVALHPLVVTDFETMPGGTGLELVLNTSATVKLEHSGQWFREPKAESAAAVRLEYGRSALFSRPAWYRLVAAASVDADGESLEIAGLSLS
ncbi:MAG: DUF1285 domain-containing protein [Pseudomonadota bacterium]